VFQIDDTVVQQLLLKHLPSLAPVAPCLKQLRLLTAKHGVVGNTAPPPSCVSLFDDAIHGVV
jgi:hypothetical protein